MGAAAVIGIGLNLMKAPECIDRPVATLSDAGVTIAPARMLEAIAESVAFWLEIWNEGIGFHTVRAAWLARSGPLGEAISVNSSGGPLSGLFAGLDADGALLMDTQGGARRRFTFGDVTLLAGA